MARSSLLALLFVLTFAVFASHAEDAPPAGFTALFNGKDLTGWRGGQTSDHRKLLAMPEDKRKEQLEKWTKTLTAPGKNDKPHWYADNNELVNDGGGDYCTTEKDYGDFELLLEYKTVALADSGIYLRGVPQVQIWDKDNPKEKANGAEKGSGALWNNSKDSPGKFPPMVADKPFGEWNKFRILMTGSRVSVWLNDKQTVDHAILENYYNNVNTVTDPGVDKDGKPNKPRRLKREEFLPVPAKGPIELQTHGGEIRWRNIFIREIGSDEANKILASHGEEGYKSIFNGKDLEGWAGEVANYDVVDGAIQCKPGKGGVPYFNEELSDFMVRLEFKLPKNGNNGLAIRYPGKGDTAYVGMCELQVLDDDYKGIDPRQAHGSIYGVVAAARGYHHPIGEWNFQEVTVKGSTIKVELNGSVILDADISKFDPEKGEMFMANHKHPGLTRKSGYFGFAGHNDPVAFRAIRLKKL